MSAVNEDGIAVVYSPAHAVDHSEDRDDGSRTQSQL